MTLPSANIEELQEFGAAMREGQPTPSQIARFNAHVVRDPSACEVYARYVLLQAMLELEFGTGLPRTNPSRRAARPVLQFLGNAIHGTIGYFSQGMPLAYLMATVVTGLGLLIGSQIHVSSS